MPCLERLTRRGDPTRVIRSTHAIASGAPDTHRFFYGMRGSAAGWLCLDRRANDARVRSCGTNAWQPALTTSDPLRSCFGPRKTMRPVATLRFARLLQVVVLVLVGAVARADARHTVPASVRAELQARADRKSTRLNSSHRCISYAL